MTEKAPLRLRLEPGTFPCTWSLPAEDGRQRELHGDIELTAGSIPRGEIYEDVPGSEIANGVRAFPQQSRYPILRAKLINGLELIGFDVVVSAWAPERATVFLRCALVGLRRAKSLEGEQVFAGLTAQVTHLDSIFGTGPIRSYGFPALDRPPLSGSWTISEEPGSVQEWNDEDALVRLSFHSSASLADPFRFQVMYSPVATIKLANEIPFDEILEQWVLPLLRIVTLCLGEPQEITALTLRVYEGGTSVEREFQAFGLGVTQSPFASSIKEVRSNQAALTTSGDQVSLLRLLRRWQELENEHHPLLETYGSFLQVKGQHPRARYLLLIQSLEGLYGHENKDEDEGRKLRHREQRQEILDVIGSCDSLISDHKRFIKKFLMKYPHGNLDRCLSESFTTLPGDVTAEIAKTPLIQNAISRNGGNLAVANALRDIRNNLAHGSKGYPAHELEDVSLILERVARAHLLRLLGCNAEIQERALGTSR
ncbi:HEPN domain-containing protein [Streptomyces sp. ok210]|uniref:ApeA N-terminal domain 1-containing protein n=1 Tax=Streptomyces sp. ok210 TaxID=1761905 RepID=UPI0008E47253|nr:HEPN domain-containing protein [Streptomyces sp. ok210]SFT30932.1 hypothetical protein SAMN04487982_116212 [Streptomyces sp. ok210]